MILFLAMIVVFGIILILRGVYYFFYALLIILDALFWYMFGSERMIDKKLFSIWKDQDDYKEFEENLNDLIK